MRGVLEFLIQLHSHPEIQISFKFIPKILMSKECIYFFGPLCIRNVYIYFEPPCINVNPVCVRSDGPCKLRTWTENTGEGRCLFRSNISTTDYIFSFRQTTDTKYEYDKTVCDYIYRV